MKIITVIGARPQFIKVAPVSRVLEESGYSNTLIHTGQHYDNNMSNIFFEELGVPEPHYNLGIGSASHGQQTGRMLEQIEKVLLKEKPDWMLVYGDTNSTLAGALAASKLHIPVAHIEAGLRSFNKKMPEEQNRIVTDHLSSLLFAPTSIAVDHLKNEGIADKNIHLCGDVMYDAAILFSERAEKNSLILKKLKLENKGYVLATIHRAENTDIPKRLDAIMFGLSSVAQKMPVVLPIHPRTRSILGPDRLNQLLENNMIKVIEPLGYQDMIMLERHATVIATDSGGIQKEAFFCNTPCVTLRDETEWEELVSLGWNQLCKPTSADTVSNTILSAVAKYGKKALPYGDGKAAEKIVEIIKQHTNHQRGH